LADVHGGAAFQVYGKAELRIDQAGAVECSGNAVHIAVEVADGVGNSGGDVCGATEETEGMEIAEDGNVEGAGGSGDGRVGVRRRRFRRCS
jgi:hypothetical protein